ncbi:hypothetical protein [Streptomyces sp. NPDC048639]|uniref:hypothetical protein n=1 Tax=Streptomyces sp. NPDC048639 TaxID=3365581 RepID=UPI003719E912
MRSRPARAALLAALTGGFLTATPAIAAPAPSVAVPASAAADCVVRTQHVEITVDRAAGTSTATATWDVVCPTATRLTAELNVLSPRRMQKPVRGTFGTRFRGSTSSAGPVDPENPQQTATLTLKAGDERIGREERRCATKPDSSPSCYPGGDPTPDIARNILGILGILTEAHSPKA